MFLNWCRTSAAPLRHCARRGSTGNEKPPGPQPFGLEPYGPAKTAGLDLATNSGSYGSLHVVRRLNSSHITRDL